VDERFWPARAEGRQGSTSQAVLRESSALDANFWTSDRREVVLNEALARDLGTAVGSTVTLHWPQASAVPRESLLGRRGVAEVVDDLPVKVAAIIGDDQLGRFSLQPSAMPARNAFVPIRLLQERLRQPARINTILAGGAADDLDGALRGELTLDDWGLIWTSPSSRAQTVFARLDRNNDGKLTQAERRGRMAEAVVNTADRDHDGILTLPELENHYKSQHGYFSLESRQLLLEPAVVDAALATAGELHWRLAPTLVYLANTIAEGNSEIPYSIVAALDPSLAGPLGPFLPAGSSPLQDDEAILAGWKETPLPMRPGDPITLRYFEPTDGALIERTARFRLKEVIPLAGPALDPDLAPEFPGITDKLDIRKWDPPFPYHNERIKKRDEDYWNQFRTIPKAYITLAAGQKLWHSRFGDCTSIRLIPPAGADPEKAGPVFRQSLLSHLDPKRGGLAFDDVRSHALAASAGSTDFSGLFLGFSSFLILAALLLVVLLFRLNLEQRCSEVGLLLATGWRRSGVRAMLLAEGALVAAGGALAGLWLALAYAALLLKLLQAWWPGGSHVSFLRLHAFEAGGRSLWIGFGTAWFAGVLAIAWALRIIARVPASALLAGQAPDSVSGVSTDPRRTWLRWLPFSCTVAALALGLSGGWVTDQGAKAGVFFTSGFLLLVAGLSFAWIWLRRPGGGLATAQATVGRLGVHNAKRHPLRSLLTIGLLGSAVFLVISVESFHRQTGSNWQDKSSGAGGFALVGESDLPIFQNLNSAADRYDLGVQAVAEPAFQHVHIDSCRLRSGDDASCLNLYQPRRPRLIGVPHSLIERSGFTFQADLATNPETKANPWRLLDADADAIPVIADANTIEWILHGKLGGTVEVPDGQGRLVPLHIVGLLAGSIFQSELVMSEKNFLKLYAGQEGYQYFLIEAPADQLARVRGVLETALATQGFEATTTGKRLDSYLAVENTYLATFQALGALGLLLGACGLAVVLLRTVWERRGELALFRALGFRRQTLGWLVLAENGALMMLGTALGTAAALVATAPPLAQEGASLPWVRLAAFLALVIAVGLAAGALAVFTSLRAPLLPALRHD
jgi:ABC-type antimicrobial peptide transport system permease subunit